MKCSHRGHPLPHRLLLFLNPWGLKPLHTLGDYYPLERIITYI